MGKASSSPVAITIEFTLPSPAERRVRTAVCVPDQPPRPHGLSYMLALAHRLEERVQSGKVKDYVAIAEASGISRTRIGQIIQLLMLAPSIQEYILGLQSSEKCINERILRTVVKEWSWDRQRAIFCQLTGKVPSAEPLEPTHI